jgi:hypothetical protein
VPAGELSLCAGAALCAKDQVAGSCDPEVVSGCYVKGHFSNEMVDALQMRPGKRGKANGRILNRVANRCGGEEYI